MVPHAFFDTRPSDRERYTVFEPAQKGLRSRFLNAG